MSSNRTEHSLSPDFTLKIKIHFILFCIFLAGFAAVRRAWATDPEPLCVPKSIFNGRRSTPTDWPARNESAVDFLPNQFPSKAFIRLPRGSPRSSASARALTRTPHKHTLGDGNLPGERSARTMGFPVLMPFCSPLIAAAPMEGSAAQRGDNIGFDVRVPGNSFCQHCTCAGCCARRTYNGDGNFSCYTARIWGLGAFYCGIACPAFLKPKPPSAVDLEKSLG